MDIIKLQKAVDEIKEVCTKHNVLIVGTPEYNQSMIIVDASNFGWDIVGNNIFNTVEYDDYNQEMYLTGLGVPDKKYYKEFMSKKKKEEEEREERIKRLEFEEGKYKVPEPFIPGKKS
jgi:hypothetical protein